MDAGSLHVLPVTRSGRVIDAHGDGHTKSDPPVQAGLSRRDGMVPETGEWHFGVRRLLACGILTLESLAFIVLRPLLLLCVLVAVVTG